MWPFPTLILVILLPCGAVNHSGIAWSRENKTRVSFRFLWSSQIPSFMIEANTYTTTSLLSYTILLTTVLKLTCQLWRPQQQNDFSKSFPLKSSFCLVVSSLCSSNKKGPNQLLPRFAPLCMSTGFINDASFNPVPHARNWERSMTSLPQFSYPSPNSSRGLPIALTMMFKILTLEQKTLCECSSLFSQSLPSWSLCSQHHILLKASRCLSTIHSYLSFTRLNPTHVVAGMSFPLTGLPHLPLPK